MKHGRTRFVGRVERLWLGAAFVALFVLVAILTRVTLGPDPWLTFLAIAVATFAVFGLRSWLARRNGEFVTASESARRLAIESLERPWWHWLLHLCILTMLAALVSSLFSDLSAHEILEQIAGVAAYLVLGLPIVVPLAAVVAYFDRWQARRRLAKLGNEA